MTKKFYEFFMCLFAVIGCIGGIGYCVWSGAWPVAAGIIVLSVLAYPTIKSYFGDLIS